MNKIAIPAIAVMALALVGCGPQAAQAPGAPPAPAQQTVNVQYVTVATENGLRVPCVLFLDRAEDAGGITCNWVAEG